MSVGIAALLSVKNNTLIICNNGCPIIDGVSVIYTFFLCYHLHILTYIKCVSISCFCAPAAREAETEAPDGSVKVLNVFSMSRND